jgi:hypothetical protein
MAMKSMTLGKYSIGVGDRFAYLPTSAGWYVDTVGLKGNSSANRHSHK